MNELQAFRLWVWAGWFPEKCRYAAMDESGEVSAFERPPVAMEQSWHYGGETVYIGKYFPGPGVNWREMLVALYKEEDSPPLIVIHISDAKAGSLVGENKPTQ